MTDSKKDQVEIADTEKDHDTLEKVKRERTNLRRAFTTACKQFTELQKKEVEGKQIHVQFTKIIDKADRLFKIDEQLNVLVTHTDEEFDLIESYRDTFIEIKTVYEKYIRTDDNDIAATTSSGINLKLPKLNLKEFDLNPRTWVAFWGQFSGIHEDQRLKEVDKFQYLLSSLKSKTKARDIADSYPPSKENYQKVVEHLRSRFGRDDLLIEVYIRDLLALVTDRANIKLGVLYDQLGTYLRALETLGVTTENYAAMLYPVVESCLPMDVLKAWDRHRLNRESNSESSRYLVKEKLIEELMTFLRNEVEGEEHRALAESGFTGPTKNKKQNQDLHNADRPSASALVSSAGYALTKTSCIFCDKSHNSQDCGKAAQMSLEKKKTAVIKKKCCLVCFKFGHMAKTCRSSVKCIICARRHYALLCPDLEKREHPRKDENTSSLFTVESSPSVIYLKTLMVRVRNKGRIRHVRALLDDGSHRSYIEKDLAKELGLSPTGKEVLSQGLFGGGQTAEAVHNRYDVHLENLGDRFFCQVSVLDQPLICKALPRIKNTKLISELTDHGIRLTDVGLEEPPIQLLLGADTLGKILTGRIEILRSGISAIETKLGWTVLGTQKKKATINMVTLSLQNCEVPKLWDLEILGITDPVQVKSKKLLDEETLVHFRETLRVSEDQHYEVALPWLAGHPPLYSNSDIAMVRLKTVTRRLMKENIFHSYHEVFLQWKSEGIIEEVKRSDIKGSVHYLPHRPVIKLSSATTKIRPVFDASVKTAGFVSLNHCLSTGPSLSQQIPPLLNRFRLGAIGVTADIKQAFLQLSVRPEDRDVLRFLWWKDTEQSSVIEYRHCRVVFGVTSSPFLLNATISHHLNLEIFKGEDVSFTIVKLKEGFYVDNLITSVESETELQVLRSQAKEIMKVGCFDLRCWAYTGVQEEVNQTVLGLGWNTVTDKLSCITSKVLMNLDEKITKRSLLSVINSVYDPIGFTCPAMLVPKLLLQEAWSRKLSWDETLHEDLQLRFDKWSRHLHLVEQCSIPRRMLRGTTEIATLHIFSDASAYAYACCVFLRCEEEDGVSLHLVSAKSRVAPMNRPTIPRMELLGAAIAA